MADSFKVFMNGSIDYAGLNPPAFLNIGKAVDNYRKYLEDKNSWLLSSFVCRASDLSEITQIFEKNKIEKKLKFNIQLNNSGKFDVMISSIKRDINFIKYFQSYNNNLAPFTFEFKIPEKVTIDQKKTSDTLGEIFRLLNYEFHEYSIFFETFVLDKNWKTFIENVNSMLAIASANVGMKLRTGGIEPTVFPQPEKIAYIIKSAEYHKIPLKATAGLNHPITHFNKTTNSKMYGFLNIISAIMLNAKYKLSSDSIVELINDENPKSFNFLKNSFNWKDYSLDNNEIEASRKFAVSFSSNCFEESIDGLIKYKFLSKGKK